jgi:hypothetical protein
MTRDQAIDMWQFRALRPIADAIRKIMREDDNVDELIDEMADREIDGFIALGMLKLDEQKIDEGYGMVFKIRAMMRDLKLGHMSPAQFDSALIRAGLKIVEEK